jgi:predicted porin
MAGPFVSAQLTDNLALNAQAGWDYTEFSKGGANGDTQNVDSYYCSAGLNHRINDVLAESLTAGRESDPGLTTNFTERVYARYTPSWQIMPNLKLAPDFWWENLDDSDGINRQTANRFGADLNVSYQVADHVTLNVGYQYILKTSNPSSLDYTQDVVTVGLKYQF